MRLLPLLLVATVASGAEVTHAGRWHLHSSFWMNLHQTLMHDAAAETPREVSMLTAEEKTVWEAAVAEYRAAAGETHPTFARPMVIAQDQLTQVADDAVRPSLPDGPLMNALRSAAPLYRKHWWAADDAANRFFIAYAAPMLREAGEELAKAHEAVYLTPLPGSIRVDVSPHAGQFGAYSHFLRNGGFTTTMSSRDPGYAGLAALEMMLHEASHAIVSPYGGAVHDAIAAASKKAGVAPPRDLWHAILFATSSELTRRALAARGAGHYKPSSEDLLTRVWPQYRQPIERHWYPYLDGTGTLEEAIGNVVRSVTAGR